MITGTINSITQLAKRPRSGSVEHKKLPASVRKGSEDPIVQYSYMLGGTSLVPSKGGVFLKSIHASASPKPTVPPSQFATEAIMGKLKEDKLDI